MSSSEQLMMKLVSSLQFLKGLLHTDHVQLISGLQYQEDHLAILRKDTFICGRHLHVVQFRDVHTS